MGGIKLNDQFAVFISNKILLNGENKMIFYNIKNNKILEEQSINGYSFKTSRYNLSLISIPSKYKKNEDDKLLFCACKKYIKGSKNGILLLKLEIHNQIIVVKDKKFLNTKNFEVHCFCPIMKNNKIVIETNNIIEADYIFVGGFDSDTKEGTIKLYKIIYNEDYKKINLEFITNISFEKYKENNENNLEEFKGFRGDINCIIQTKDNENILMSSSDGNIYSFSGPTLESIENLEKINLSKLNY